MVAISSDGSSGMNDTVSNSWTPLTQASNGTPTIRLFYCINPITSASHTFTPIANFPTIYAAAFLGPIDTTFLSESGSGTASPGALGGGANHLAVTAHSGIFPSPATVNDAFDGVQSLDYVDGVHMQGGGAHKISVGAITFNPTWTPADASVIAVFQPTV